jgi:hypothetical protein
MPELSLTGLRPHSPIGAMAAFGLLRIVTRALPNVRPKLKWQGENGEYHATLITAEPVSREQLIAALIDDVQAAAQRPELAWSETIKGASPHVFTQECAEASTGSTQSDRDRADWLTAFSTELSVKDERLLQTPFDMSVARQKFLLDAGRLAAFLGKTNRGGKQKSPREDYLEALFGPWRYEDDQHSLGWDPTTIKLGAFTHKPPTAMENRGVRAAVWLAFESLPMFPCFYEGGMRIRATKREGRELSLFWPVWRNPVSLRELETLLSWPLLTADSDPRDERRARGLLAIYRSVKVKPNQYMVTFRAPELVYSAW